MVRGEISNIRNNGNGAPWLKATAEICLGNTAGLVSDIERVHITLEPALGQRSSIPFHLMLVNGSFYNTQWGASMSISSAMQLCLYARIDPNFDNQLGQQYSYNIGNVEWLWFDRTAIPVSEQAFLEPSPGSGGSLLSPSPYTYTMPAVYGGSGQKWLHFVHWSYRPALGNTAGTIVPPAPAFKVGTNDGTNSLYYVGTGPNAAQPRFGQKRNIPYNGLVRTRPILRQTAWFYEQKMTVGGSAPTFFAMQPNPYAPAPSPAAQAQLHYTFALRLDNLSDVLVRSEATWSNLTGNRYTPPPAEGSAYLALERPATGSATAPVIMARGIVQTTGTQDYCLEIYSNTGSPISTSTVHARSDAGAAEGVLLSTMSRMGLSGTTSAIQYRTRWTGGDQAAASSLTVRDVQILQLNLVSGVDPDPTLPAVASYLTLTPGRESANPATLSPLPIAPDAEQGEDATVATEAIAGTTGYVRTWPLFARVRRQFSLQWSALSGANATTVANFLRDNPAFRFRPHRETADIAVVQLDAPSIEQASGHVYAIGVRVAELIWTD